jgi:FAD/FMN-containing dehydrogenase
MSAIGGSGGVARDWSSTEDAAAPTAPEPSEAPPAPPLLAGRGGGPGAPAPAAGAVRVADLPLAPAVPLTDHAGVVEFSPQLAVAPTSIGDLAKVLAYASQEGRHVKALGSLHSSSGVQAADDIAVLPQGLSFVDPPAALDDGTLRAGVDPAAEKLVRVGSGTQLRTLNPALWGLGLALPNMGGYDEQTVAGVVNTATHGSGLEYGPISELVRSMDMVVPGGRKVRIEPKDGMTDPAAFRAAHPDMELIQDDETFHAATAGLGSMGVAYSYVLGVRDKFYMQETRTATTWTAAKELLAQGGIYGLNTSAENPADPARRFPAQHVEFLVNPYATKGDHSVVVTTRKDVPAPTDPTFQPGSRSVLYRITHPQFTRPWAAETVLDVAPNVVGEGSRDAVHALPALAPALIDSSLQGLVHDKYIERSYNVFNIGAANHVDAFAEEVAIPLKGDNYLQAIDALLAKAEEFRAKGWPTTAPFSLRFVKQSTGTLAPQQEDCCMVELIFAKGTPHAREMAQGYEDVLARFGGRPHFGQMNSMTPEKTEAMYGERLAAFNRVRRALDPDGVMRNAATDRAIGPP